MKIPKLISPDNLKDAIVEVKYAATKTPFEVAIGLFYKSLDDTYTYTNRPVGIPQLPNWPIGISQLPITLPLYLPPELKLTFGGQSFFYNNKIKIELKPNSIIFNCFKEYITWKKYKPEIEKVLSQLAKANIIENYTRVGIRYVNVYPDIDFKDCIKFSYTLGMPEINSETYTFHSEFKVDDLKVNLNLSNKLQTISAKSIPGQVAVTPVSIIDVDVIKDNFNETEYKNILPYIETIHTKEKEIFFNLLEDKFLETLNPIY
jgi:uncharacterized protein (TIGR04255 family)